MRDGKEKQTGVGISSVPIAIGARCAVSTTRKRAERMKRSPADLARSPAAPSPPNWSICLFNRFNGTDAARAENAHGFPRRSARRRRPRSPAERTDAARIARALFFPPVFARPRAQASPYFPCRVFAILRRAE